MRFLTWFFVSILFEVSYSTYFPFGFKMCDLFCRQHGDCTVFGFSSNHHLCILETHRSIGDILLYNVSKDKPAPCHGDSRHIQRRNGHHICIKKVDKLMLIVPTLSRRKDYAILFNMKISEGEFDRRFPSDGIYSIAYMSSFHKLVISRKKHNQVQEDILELRGLMSTSSDILVEKHRPRDLTVDDSRHLVFFINDGGKAGGSSVYRVNASSRVSTLVRKGIVKKSSSITADARRQQLYISLSTKMISLSYHGTNEHIIVRKLHNIITLSLSYSGNHLLFNDRCYFMESTINGKGKRTILKFHQNIVHIINHKDKSFISFMRSRYIVIFDLSNNKSIYTQHMEDPGLQMSFIT